MVSRSLYLCTWTFYCVALASALRWPWWLGGGWDRNDGNRSKYGNNNGGNGHWNRGGHGHSHGHKKRGWWGWDSSDCSSEDEDQPMDPPDYRDSISSSSEEVLATPAPVAQPSEDSPDAPEEPPVDPCRDNPSFEDENGYTCKEWEGYNCAELAAAEFNMSEEGIQALLENCCETCSANLGEESSEEGGGQGSGEADDSASGDDLDFPSYRVLCEGQEEPATCREFGCKWRPLKEMCSAGASIARKVKCKNIKSEDVCQRLGCSLKNAKCKGKPTNIL